MMSATNAQLLPPGLLRDLQSLNLRFLYVLCRATRENDGAAAVHGLPATLAVRLAELDEGQLREISACPCSLFAVDWTRLLNAAAGIAEEAAWCGSDDPRGKNLCTALIVFAAQLARTRPLAARIILGCRDRTVRRLSGVTVGAILDRLATGAWELRVRYAANRRFWPDLLLCTERADADRLVLARSLAVQLSVQEACRTSLAANSI